jgi:pimeloyl-ACP methyl ester carboxylesterase
MVLIDTEQPQGLTRLFKQFLLAAKLPYFEHILAWALMHRRLRKSRFVLGGCFADLALLDGEFQELFLEPIRENRERRWAAAELARRFDQSYVHMLSEVHKKIEIPVKLVWGRRDPFFPIKQTREMLKTFTDASLFILREAKLFSHEEFPEQVASEILPTLLGKSSQDFEAV